MNFFFGRRLVLAACTIVISTTSSSVLAVPVSTSREFVEYLNAEQNGIVITSLNLIGLVNVITIIILLAGLRLLYVPMALSCEHPRGELCLARASKVIANKKLNQTYYGDLSGQVIFWQLKFFWTQVCPLSDWFLSIKYYLLRLSLDLLLHHPPTVSS